MIPRPIRKAIFFLFVGAFFVSAPLVVLYTAGYRFNRTNSVVSQTGTLSVASSPRGAETFINGENIHDATPAVVQRLPTGTRTVLLQKSGFYPWERTVNILSGNTTYVTAPLFLIADPLALGEGTSAWERAQTARTPLATSLPRTITLKTTDAGIEVILADTHANQPPLTLLPTDTYTPLISGKEDLFLTNSKGDVFLLSLTHTQAPIFIGKNISAFAWDEQERQLAWTDGLEVHLLFCASGMQELLTRQGDDITALTFAHDGESLVVASQHGMIGIDLASYVDGRLQTALATFSEPTDVWFSEDGSIAYFETSTSLFAQTLTR